MNDTPKVLDFSHNFVFLANNDLPACDSPIGYIVLRDNTVEKICAYGHVADWQRFESPEIASVIAGHLAETYRVSLRNESEWGGRTTHAPDGAVRCPNCGELKLEELYCTNCGSDLPRR